MPISRERFNVKKRPLDERIFEHLEQHPEQGWSPLELIQALESIDNEADAAIYMNVGFLASGEQVRAAYEHELGRLVHGGLVEAVSDGGVPYYAVVDGATYRQVKMPWEEANERGDNDE